jgi:SAM-dependent methyltransferase
VGGRPARRAARALRAPATLPARPRRRRGPCARPGLHEAGAHPVGVDVAREPLRRAAQRQPRLELRLWPALQPLPAADDEFDAAWAGEVIEHVADTPGWLAEVRRSLRRDGLLLLTTPAHARALRLRLALSDRAFEEHFSVRADHLRFFTVRALRTLLADLGFDDVHVTRDGPTLLARGRRG